MDFSVKINVVISLISLISVTYAQQYIGDWCTLSSTGEQGQCALLKECNRAIQDLQKFGRIPQTCTFQGSDPVVCCPGASIQIPTTPTTTTTTRRTTTTRTTRRTTTTPYVPFIPSNGPRQPGAMSYDRCRYYTRFVSTKKKPPTLDIGAEEVENDECGFKVIELVVGGKPANEKEFPHMALVGFQAGFNDIRWLCGGSIISEQFVLTAAHCLSHLEFGEASYIKMGITHLDDRAFMQQVRIVDRIPHPQFRAPSHYHDIALIRMDSQVKMTPYARPACLYNKNYTPNVKALATGWGKTDYAGSGSDQLLKVTLEFYGINKCNQSYQNQIGSKLLRGIDNSIQLCAGTDNDEEKDTCQGDSGGPLQIYHTQDSIKCMYDIVGVTSFGKACGIGKQPGVYTRVSNYIKWIEDIVWPQ